MPFLYEMVAHWIATREQKLFDSGHGCTLDAKMGTNFVLETPWLSAGCWNGNMPRSWPPMVAGCDLIMQPCSAENSQCSHLDGFYATMHRPEHSMFPCGDQECNHALLKIANVPILTDSMQPCIGQNIRCSHVVTRNATMPRPEHPMFPHGG